MTDRAEESERGEVVVTPEATELARRLGAEVREAAASLPFGTDPGEFLAALECLADSEGRTVPPDAG